METIRREQRAKQESGDLGRPLQNRFLSRASFRGNSCVQQPVGQSFVSQLQSNGIAQYGRTHFNSSTYPGGKRSMSLSLVAVASRVPTMTLQYRHFSAAKFSEQVLLHKENSYRLIYWASDVPYVIFKSNSPFSPLFVYPWHLLYFDIEGYYDPYKQSVHATRKGVIKERKLSTGL